MCCKDSLYCCLMTCNINEFKDAVMLFFFELFDELFCSDFIVNFRYSIDLFDNKWSDLNSSSLDCWFIFEEFLIISFHELDLFRSILLDNVLNSFELSFSRIMLFCFIENNVNTSNEELNWDWSCDSNSFFRVFLIFLIFLKNSV